MRDAASPFTVRVVNANARATRAVSYVRSRPSWVTRAALWAMVIAGLVLGLLILVPLMLIAGAAFTVLALFGWIRAKIAGARRPNAAFDGRRNVRVIVRDD